MDQSVITVLTALIVAGSTLLGVHITNKSSERRTNRQIDAEQHQELVAFRRNKLEELYVLLGKWSKIIIAHYSQYSLIFAGRTTAQNVADATKALEGGTDFGRIGMINTKN